MGLSLCCEVDMERSVQGKAFVVGTAIYMKRINSKASARFTV